MPLSAASHLGFLLFAKIIYYEFQVYEGLKSDLIHTVHVNLCKTATLKKTKKLVYYTNYRLMQVKSIAECSKRSIL